MGKPPDVPVIDPVSLDVSHFTPLQDLSLFRTNTCRPGVQDMRARECQHLFGQLVPPLLHQIYPDQEVVVVDRSSAIEGEWPTPRRCGAITFPVSS